METIALPTPPGDTASPFFTRHAAAYAQSPGHARGEDLRLLVEALDPQAGQLACDVATGTGHTAMALAACGAEVDAADPTPAMLAEAERLAAERGLDGRIRWVRAAVDNLPLRAGHYHCVTCRRAFHHFPDPGHALTAMVRLLVAGGRLGVSDMCPPTELAVDTNRLERLRDPTHREALTDDTWRALLARAGLTIRYWRTQEERSSLTQWLAPVRLGEPAGLAVQVALGALPPARRERLQGGVPDGWVKRRLVFVAER